MVSLNRLRALILGNDIKSNPAKVAMRDTEVISDLFDIMGLDEDSCVNVIFDKNTLKEDNSVERYNEDNMHVRLSKIFKMRVVRQLRKPIDNEIKLISLFKTIAKKLDYKIESVKKLNSETKEYITKYWIATE
jgi:hypothetical protein